jgi:hypothetical protein
MKAPAASVGWPYGSVVANSGFRRRGPRAVVRAGREEFPRCRPRPLRGSRDTHRSNRPPLPPTPSDLSPDPARQQGLGRVDLSPRTTMLPGCRR